MGCTIANDTLLGCAAVVGITTVWVGTYNGTSMGFTVGSTQSLITAFTGATVSFYQLQQQPSAAEFTSPASINVQNNATGYTQTLTFMLYAMSAATSNTLQILGQGIFRVIFLTRQGKYFMMGINAQCNVTAIAGGSGVGLSDLNGHNITITSEDYVPYYEVTAAAAASVLQ